MSPSVLFVTHAGDPGGAEFKMLDLCRTLGDRADVLLFQHGSLETTLAEEGIRHAVLPMPAAASAFRRESGLWSAVRAAPGLLSMVHRLARHARRFDIVVCFSQKSFVLASLAKPFTRRPIVWFMNDILTPAHFNPLLIRLLTLLSRRAADHVVLNSQASLEAWLDSGGRENRVSVVYPGIDDRQIGPQLADVGLIDAYRARFSPDARPLVGMFGRMSRWKGQDVFLRAIAQLPEVRAVIVGGALFGEEPYEAQVHQLAKDLGIEDRVSFVGHVNDAIVLMAACNVIAHCSTEPEPFGLVIAEAMLAGTPVIASDAGGAREIVTHSETGQLTPLKDHEALAAAIRRYLEDPSWSSEMAQRARARAQQLFSGNAMTTGFLKVVESL